MVDRAHTAWRDGSVIGVPLIDSKAAFPSVGRGSLIHTMKGKGIDGDLIRWMATVLSNQTVELVIERNVMERRPVEGGLPQRSTVSPILFANYISGLIQWVE